MRLRTCQLSLALTLMAMTIVASVAKAQNPDTMAPEASEAKGRQILNQLIAALGGPAYLNEKTSECDGRLAQFGPQGRTARCA